ncbi:hypothetical protein F5883DRAFT_261142 [Diaporthe sp. PMI_573]|nr:hypothetical protein F5883DRAFT_261142 [Diaporthaceae sp. PMI_573]
MGLFSKKKKEPVEENPYANPITPYQQARNDVAKGAMTGGLPSNPRMNSFGSNPAPPPYQSPSVATNGSRFGDEKYGNQNGYGSNRYDNDNQSRAGGYGGFGDDAGSNELFGGASSRYVAPQQGSNGPPANGSAPFKSSSSRYDNDPSKGALLGNARDRYNPLPPSSRQEAPAEDDEYGGYGAPRELTEEEKEEQDVQNIKDETKIARRAGVDTSGRIRDQANNIRAMAAQTAARTAAQGDRLRRTDQNMNIAAAHSRVAEGNIKTLKRINGSMFSGMTPNSSGKKKKAEDAMMEQYRADKEEQEKSKHRLYKANADMEETFSSLGKPKQKLLGGNKADARKDFSFENDSEDEAMEDEYEANMDETALALSEIKQLAIGTNREITSQNELLGEMTKKSDRVDDQVRLNRSKLNHFH